jgi:hypothetical protein
LRGQQTASLHLCWRYLTFPLFGKEGQGRFSNQYQSNSATKKIKNHEKVLQPTYNSAILDGEKRPYLAFVIIQLENYKKLVNCFYV